MGLLDLPAPLLSWVDGRLIGFLPPAAKLLIWAVAGALVSMEAYRLLSPQQRIRALETGLRDARQRLERHDGSFQDAWSLIREMLGLASRRVLLVLPATLAASLPLLVLIVWLDATYGREIPASGEPVSVQVADGFDARWIAGPDGTPPRAEVLDSNGVTVADVTVQAPIAVIHKPRWWNLAVGNPAGYLPSDAPVDRIDLGLPRQQLLFMGPGWMRGWEFAFFATLIVFALLFKVVRRIS